MADKGETMTITINSTDLLALLGDNGEHWVKGKWGDDQQMCLHGAIRHCQPQPGDAFLIEQVAFRQGWGTDWNDNEDTDWAMVRERIVAGIEVTDEMLADTFGPQWVHVVALVRRAAMLTADEAQRLAVAWDAARDDAEAAGAAAGVAARAAAGVAARAAAGDGAETAAGDAAWNAAGYAALALAIRHLIGQHGFTQAHYDVLTRPWATVIGPVHPEDEEARRGR